MKFTAQQLADILHGKVDGDPQALASTFSKIEHGRQGSLCFYANPKYESYVYGNKASIILVNNDFEPKGEITSTLVRVENAYSALSELLSWIAASRKKYVFHRGRSRIALSAKLGKKVWVGDFCTIGKKTTIGDFCKICDNVTIGENVRIGSKCIIYPGVVIFPGTVIGDRTILHSGCIIGDDGFGNAPQEDGTWKKIEHLGNVVIGSDVEIGSNTTVDKAPMESTIIGDGVRIDNLCQIAHNVVVGENTVMAAQTGIAGSAQIGQNCIIAGQVGIVGHIKVAPGTTIGAQAGVIGNVRKSGEVLLGMPAIDSKHFMRAYAKFKAAAVEDE